MPFRGALAVALLVLPLLAPGASASASMVHLAWDGEGFVVVFTSASAAPHVAWRAGSDSGIVTPQKMPAPPGDGDVVWAAKLPGRALTYEVEGQSFSAPAPPPAGATVRVAFVADVGRSEDSWKVLDAVRAAKPDLVIAGGDITYANGVSSKWDQWLTAAQPLAASVPLMTALGNHETYCDKNGQLEPCSREPAEYLEHFRMPNEGKLYYDFDWGPAHFVALDTEAYHPDDATQATRTDPAAQKAFLEASLAKRADAWNVVYFHRPLYSSNVHDDGADAAAHDDLVPVLDAGGADLVLYGHAHAYERTYALKADAVATRERAIHEGDGIFYVDSGGGGRSLYTEFEDPAPFWSAQREARWEFVLVTLSPQSVVVEAVSPDGRAFDSVSIARAGGELAPLPTPDAPRASAGAAVPDLAPALVVSLVALAALARRVKP